MKTRKKLATPVGADVRFGSKADICAPRLVNPRCLPAPIADDRHIQIHVAMVGLPG